MSAEVPSMWVHRVISRNTLLLLSLFVEDVFAATNVSELSGLLAAGFIAFLLLVSIIVYLVYFCKSRSRHEQTDEKMKDQVILQGPMFEGKNPDRWRQTAASAPVLRSEYNPFYRDRSNSRYEDSLFAQQLPTFGSVFDRRHSAHSRDIVIQPSCLDRYYTSSINPKLLNVSTIQARAMVHEMFDPCNRANNELDTSVSTQNPDIIFRKREDTSPVRRSSYQSEYGDISATDFMLDMKSERGQRTGVRYANNIHHNGNPGKNTCAIVAVDVPTDDTHPEPDYDDVSISETNPKQEDTVQTNKEVLYDTFDKQVQFNSNPVNI